MVGSFQFLAVLSATVAFSVACTSLRQSAPQLESPTPASASPTLTLEPVRERPNPTPSPALGPTEVVTPTPTPVPSRSPIPTTEQEERLQRLVAQFSLVGWKKTDFTKRTVPLEEVSYLGLGADAIPPIYYPLFDSIAEADEWLEDPEPVLIVELGGEAKAYPLGIMSWHEIVNDEIGGVPMAVTW